MNFFLDILYSLTTDFHAVRVKYIMLMKPQFKTLNMKATLSNNINKHDAFQGNCR